MPPQTLGRVETSRDLRYNRNKFSQKGFLEMKKTIAALTTGLVALSSAATAQETALQEATRRAVCGAKHDPVSAEYLADGRLKVICPPGSNPAGVGAGAGAGASAAGAAQPALLAGTGLGGAGAALLGAALLVIIAGNNETGTTTTTTTTDY